MERGTNTQHVLSYFEKQVVCTLFVRSQEEQQHSSSDSFSFCSPSVLRFGLARVNATSVHRCVMMSCVASDRCLHCCLHVPGVGALKQEEQEEIRAGFYGLPSCRSVASSHRGSFIHSSFVRLVLFVRSLAYYLPFSVSPRGFG